jgi:YHS domain-containing protein
MFVTIVIAALVVDGLFGGAGLIPHSRPSRGDIFSSVKVDYKLFTNIAGLLVFASLFGLTMRRGATDPVCGMTVDRKRAVRLERDGATAYFCSEHCKQKYAGAAH